MASVIQLFGFALIAGTAFAGVPHEHHHHNLGYRGYAQVVAAGPAVVAKSSPLLVSKGVPAYYSRHAHHAHAHALAAPAYYTHAHGHNGLAHGHTHGLGLAHGHLGLSHGHLGLAHGHGLGHGHGLAHGHAYAHVPAAYLSGAGVGIPAAYAGPSAEHLALLSTAGKPKVYAQSIPAAAVRNIETVMVTKTITPVVTKTTTRHTHAEPALSLGHVQGYSQGAVGHAKIAPVQFNTAYTAYANPTVGINGPVVYSGPAAALGYAKTAIAHEPVVKAAGLSGSPHGAYAVYPGSALGLSAYGYDAHSVPVANFLDLRSGKAVYAANGHAHHGGHEYLHK